LVGARRGLALVRVREWLIRRAGRRGMEPAHAGMKSRPCLPSRAPRQWMVAAMWATAISWLIVLGPTDGAQSVAGICIYVPPIGRYGPGSNGPGSEKPSIDSTFA